jgi:hypothetical protein
VTCAIRDKHLLKQLDRERLRRGQKTLTKTAGQLLTERLAQLELQGRGARKARVD